MQIYNTAVLALINYAATTQAINLNIGGGIEEFGDACDNFACSDFRDTHMKHLNC